MKALVIYAHPDSESITSTIYKKVCEGLVDAGHKVDKYNLYENDLDFRKVKQKREKFIDEVQSKLKEADSLVLVYPVWWYNMPAIVKNFFDRVFENNFAFEEKVKEVKIPFSQKTRQYKYKNGLLNNIKKVKVINTADSSWFKRKFIYKDSSFSSIKNGVLKVAGMDGITNLTIRSKDTEKIASEMYELGKNF